jgi:hypothetical protein
MLPRIYHQANRIGTPNKRPVSNELTMLLIFGFFVLMMIYAGLTIKNEINEETMKISEIQSVKNSSSVVLVLDDPELVILSSMGIPYSFSPSTCYSINDDKENKLIEFHTRGTGEYLTEDTITVTLDKDDTYICFKENGDHYNLVAQKNEETQEWEKVSFFGKIIFKIKHPFLY